MTELRQRPGDQPLPEPNEHPAIADLVMADLEQRRQLGIARYGTPLQPHNGRDALQDLYEELLDGACYIRQAMYERGTGSAQCEREAELAEPAAPPKPISIGTGMPGTTHLEAFGQCLRDAFGAMPYHVGSSIHGKSWRDVDVRIMLDDDRFDALFPGYASWKQRDAWWALVCSAISELGKQRTGLPIDFQVQRASYANEKFSGPRNPLFVGHAEEDHRPTMKEAGDA